MDPAKTKKRAKPESVVRIVTPPETPAPPPPDEKKSNNCGRHVIGCLLILPLLIFHFLCFIVILALGIGCGILAAVLHEICWDQKFYAFWQMYVTLVALFIAIELFFRVGFDTTLTNWMNRQQEKHRIELYYIPRGLYLLGYMVAVCLLFYAYQGAHKMLNDPQVTNVKPVVNNAPNDAKTETTTAKIEPVADPKRNSTFDGEGDVDNWKTNPLSLSVGADHFHYSMIFFISICYMMYTLSKENDWITHRRTVMEAKQPDPIVRGGVGNFVLFLGSHIIMTCIYGLPLVGAVFLARQFDVGAVLTYISGVFMAVLVGIGAMYIERRRPFPTKPMTPPGYAYENHLRIRMAIFQLWLLPFAAGRYFDANRAVTLDAQNDDLLVFTVEVGIGVVQAIKIFGNDVFLLKAIYFPPKTSEAKNIYGSEEEDGLTYTGNSTGSIISIAQSTQTMYDQYGDDDLGGFDSTMPPNDSQAKIEPKSSEPEQNVIVPYKALESGKGSSESLDQQRSLPEMSPWKEENADEDDSAPPDMGRSNNDLARDNDYSY